jgi:ABC-type dipeptide/oligopeptide/nickel transport system ATPase component/ABC-type dipeptide/oligopeptide/nickel transport system permease subunit
MLGLLVLTGLLTPPLLGPQATTLSGAVRLPPSTEHLLGTDEFGRDLFARALVATQLTLIMSTLATLLAVLGGVVVGGAAWTLPAAGRNVVLRLVDATVAFPSLITALVIAAILGPGATSAVIAIGVAGIPSFARLVSSMTAAIINRDFVITARLLGTPASAIFSRHIMPNIAGPLLMLTTSSFAYSLLEISSLSFVGLGVQNPQFDYGRLLNEALPVIYTQPWAALGPCALLIFAGVSVMLIGDGLADRLDPRRRLKVFRSTVHANLRPAESVDRSSNLGDAVVHVEQLTVETRAGRRLVKDVTLRIDPGEILGLVGESGSGKSMTAMALAGLLDEDLTRHAARITIGDIDMLAKPDPGRLAMEVGLVYQDPVNTYNPAMLLGSQLTEVLRIHGHRPKRQSRDVMTAALGALRITDPARRLKQHAFELSGGMLQRSTIAAATVTQPRLVIADEPTTALDVTVQLDVLREFKRINTVERTAMLFISHDIGVVTALCDRVAVMCQGEIVEELTATALAQGMAQHPYTRKLLETAPTLPTEIRGVSR